ncbi:MAG TPA: GH116 family glycosyl-hydrolase [Chitinophagaceae bacterium]|nr:GH116 family glycosyl-hydrolase [Chitinophagaceae bacterium]
MKRRSFIISSGILTAGTFASRARAIAGPFLPGEIIHNIPVDKKLDPRWVRSLSKRGAVTRYFKSKNELKYIGMPVGGICTGTLYLGGDGRLWLWDIFNANQEGVDPKTIEWQSELHVGKKVRPRDGSAYVQPAKDIRPVEQGFAFRIRSNGRTLIKKMEASDWDEIIFEATYPMARVHYVDKSLKLDLYADIYSPFIPLDDKNSGLPAAVYSFSMANRSNTEIGVDILGWLENKTSIRLGKENDLHVNRVSGHSVECSTRANNDPEQQNAADFGTMAIAPVGANAALITDFSLPVTDQSFDRKFNQDIEKKFAEQLIAAVVSSNQIQPSTTVTADFVYTWHFPNLRLHKAIQDKGRYYNNWFKSASAVAGYVVANFPMLSSQTRLWKNTWYNSTLPWWLLERSLVNISTLSTTTAHRFESGRFYAWEGVGCCEGTCMHVWQYAQAMGRIFPAVERDTRERVDLGLSLQPDGMMWYRGEVVKGPAIDGQAGTILRIYREHQMSADDSFLKNNWGKIKLATQWVINQDRNKDGMEDTPVENTLDAVWDGEIAWLVGLCIAAVKAGELMAVEMNDIEFAKSCAEYVRKGKLNMEEKLFNGEYFIHKPDAEKGRAKLGSYNTCHIDQVYGQSWAHQVGIGRVIDKEKTLSALKALWKYNFTPDVGPYIKDRPGGRPYALPGEGGLVMNTNPANEPRPYGENVTWQLGYFHECMSGFEHQVAAHMMAEGMIDESLVITRMIHDRYHAAKRNPFNEIECSDHYARAMASYGTFISACGYEYHGPKGYMAFAPKLGAEKFRAPFVSASGWGTYSQEKKGQRFTAELHLAYGQLTLSSFSFECPVKVQAISVKLADQKIDTSFTQEAARVVLKFEKNLNITEDQKLVISL